MGDRQVEWPREARSALVDWGQVFGSSILSPGWAHARLRIEGLIPVLVAPVLVVFLENY